MPRFNVTYEITTPESAAEGDCESRGFVLEDGTLREAMCEMDGHATEANVWPFDATAVRWFTNDDYGNGTRAYYERSETESRSLHLPKTVTPSSARRIARLLGIRGA